MGDFFNIDRSERICKHCSLGNVEYEFHLILICPFYERIREKHILKILLQKTFCAETYSITLYRKVLRIMWIGAISTIQYQLESRNRCIALNIMDIRTWRILKFNCFFS